MTEKKVRDMIRLALRDQMKSVPTKADIKKIAKEEAVREAKKASKDLATQRDVRDIIKKTMLSYHKWMWEKKGMWISQI